MTTLRLITRFLFRYTLFSEIFDLVIDERHGGYATDAVHPSDMDVSKIKVAAQNTDRHSKYSLRA